MGPSRPIPSQGIRPLQNLKLSITRRPRWISNLYPQGRPMSKSNGFLPPHGNYRNLLSYRKAEIIYDLTWTFCQRFLSRGDRTIDQMIQAARPGKQNIAEGSMASGTSKETEIKLTNVARDSLEELKIDYEDHLRTRSLNRWSTDSTEALYIRKLSTRDDFDFDPVKPFVVTRPAEVVANIALCLIHQATFLLERQLRQLEADFVVNGGLGERMTRARLSARGKSDRE